MYVCLKEGLIPTLNYEINLSISRRMRWVGHVARVGESRGAYRVLVRNLMERDHLEDSGVDGRVILKRIFKKWDEGGMNLIAVAKNRDKWRGLVNAVMNLRVP